MRWSLLRPAAAADCVLYPERKISRGRGRGRRTPSRRSAARGSNADLAPDHLA